MSFFGEINQDAVRGSIDDASVGPRLGFQDAFVAAWDATTKAHSMLAVEQGIRAKEQEQIKRIREAGLRPPNSLDDSEDTQPILGGDNSDRNPLATTFRQGRYSAAAQSIVDGGGWYTDEMVAQRDEHLRKLQADRPDLGIQTYGEMFKSVQNDAQEAEKRSQLPKTTFGHVGAFIGEAAGSMDPSSNPLNFATMGVGGGTGVVGRAVVQGIAQGATEAVNLAAADPENLLLGHQRTPGEDVGRIGMAMIAGAGADLLFSGAHAAIRKARTGKWFVDQPLPEPPAPKIDTTPAVFQGEVPPPPKAGLPLHEYPDWESFARAHGEEPNAYGPSREARPRTAIDLNYMSTELNRWDGQAPWEVQAPRTDTASFRAPDNAVRVNPVEDASRRYLDSLETPDAIARRVDPDLFRKYDVLEANVNAARAELARLETPTPQGRQAVIPDLPPLEPRRTLGLGERTSVLSEQPDWKPGRIAELKRQMINAQQDMRNMAPLVERAFARAQGEWQAGLSPDAVAFFKRLEDGTEFRYRGESEPSLTEKPPRPRASEQPIVSPTTVDDAVPLASMEPGIDNRLHVDTDTAAERVKQNVAHTIEKLDEKVDHFAKVAEKQAKLEAKDVVEQTKALEEKLTKLRTERSAAASSTGVKEAFDTLKGGGVSEDFYRRAFEAYSNGGTRVAGINEPKLAQARRSGMEFGSPADVRTYYEGRPAEPRTSVSEQIAKVEKELDELHYVTFPDGRKLHLDNDSAPFVHEDGRVEEMSVRDFMREMAKDQDALKSVVSCSRPS